MKKYAVLFCVVYASLSAALALADEEVRVSIDSLTNADNRAMEVCGTAMSVSGAGPLMVTVEHGPAAYSTLVSKKGKWCVLIKRWNYSGSVQAEGSILK